MSVSSTEHSISLSTATTTSSSPRYSHLSGPPTNNLKVRVDESTTSTRQQVKPKRCLPIMILKLTLNKVEEQQYIKVNRYKL